MKEKKIVCKLCEPIDLRKMRNHFTFFSLRAVYLKHVYGIFTVYKVCAKEFQFMSVRLCHAFRLLGRIIKKEEMHFM